MGRNFKKIRIGILDILFIFSLLLLLSLSIPTTLNYEKVAAEDWNRHSLWVQRLIQGDFTTIYEYPPAFHLLMSLPVYLLANNIKYIQIVFSIISSASILYFVYKTHEKIAMEISSLLLGTSLVYLIFNFQLTPQAIDYILFPLITLAYFKDKYFTTSIGLIFLWYNHFIGIIFFGIIFIYSLLSKRDFLKYAIMVLIIALPIIFIGYIPFFIQIINSNYMFLSGASQPKTFFETGQIWQTEWDKQYTYPIDNFFIFNGFIAWLLLPITIYFLFKQRQIDKYQKFYIIWLICLMPLIIFNILRWSSYFIIPFSIFEASVLAKGMQIENKIKERFDAVFGE